MGVRCATCARTPRSSIPPEATNRELAVGDEEALVGYLKRLDELGKEYERANQPFEIHVISFDAFTVAGCESSKIWV
jgi:hypothetical protein